MKITTLFVQIAAVLIALFGSSAAATANSTQDDAEPNFWLVKEGKHINLIFRTRDAGPALPIVEAQPSSGPLVMLSWGDAVFYQAAEKSLAMTLKALLLPTKAAINARTLASLDEAPQTHASAKVYPMHVQQSKLQRMLRRINAALSNSQNTVTSLGDNAAVGGHFYAAEDRRYSLLFTCNNWAADVMRSGSLPYSRSLTQFAGAVVLQHKLAWAMSKRYRTHSRFSAITVGKHH